MMQVKLTATRNYCVREERRHMLSKFEEVDSLQEASTKVLEFVDEHDLTGGTWDGGDVIQNGVKIAKISHTGKITPITPVLPPPNSNPEYTVEYIRARIAADPRWTEHAIVALFRNQTADEQCTGETRELNGVGFNGLDAPFMTSLAEWILNGRHLTPKQCAVARRKLVKYAGQLTRIANMAAL